MHSRFFACFWVKLQVKLYKKSVGKYRKWGKMQKMQKIFKKGIYKNGFMW